MKKYMKCFIGTIINVVTGIVGAIVWALQSDTVHMKSDYKTAVMAIVAVAFIPSAILYVVWFAKSRKNLEVPGGKILSFVPFFCIGLVLTAVITLIPGVAVFPKALTYMIIALAAAVVGNLVSYLTMKP